MVFEAREAATKAIRVLAPENQLETIQYAKNPNPQDVHQQIIKIIMRGGWI